MSAQSLFRQPTFEDGFKALCRTMPLPMTGPNGRHYGVDFATLQSQTTRLALDQFLLAYREKRKVETVVDFGCGNGTLAAWLAYKLDAQVYAYDLGDRRAEIEKWNTLLVQHGVKPIKFIQADVRNLTINDMEGINADAVITNNISHFLSPTDNCRMYKLGQAISKPDATLVTTFLSYPISANNWHEEYPGHKPMVEMTADEITNFYRRQPTRQDDAGKDWEPPYRYYRDEMSDMLTLHGVCRNTTSVYLPQQEVSLMLGNLAGTRSPISANKSRNPPHPTHSESQPLRMPVPAGERSIDKHFS